MTISTISQSASVGASATQSKAASIVSMLLGASFIFAIGFSHIEAIHNAAHDTRHSSAFPCH